MGEAHDIMRDAIAGDFITLIEQLGLNDEWIDTEYKPNEHAKMDNYTPQIDVAVSS